MADISRIRVDSTTYNLKDARLPAPGADGTGLVSVNGEWVQTPGYGYSVTEDSFVLGEFTSADFTQEGTEYKATIPLTSELLTLLQRMFTNHEEFNVTIDGTTYNSVADQFTYTDDPSIYLQDVFRLEPNSNYTALTFFVPTAPSSARIYGSVTTYTQFDRRLLPPNENNLNIENGIGTRAVLVNDVDGNTASGNYATAEGYGTGATADYSHAEGYQSSASGQESHAEGHGTVASGTRSHSEGLQTDALGNASHAEGANTEAFGTYSHAEGYGTLAGGQYSHSEGQSYSYGGFTQIRITAEVDATNRIYSVDSVSNLINVDNFILATDINGVQDYVRIVGIDSANLQIKLSKRVLAGNYNVFKYGAFGSASHIEGTSNIAVLNDTHAEGNLTKAKGGYSHAEGHETNASGDCSHAEGYRTISGDKSHSEGHSTMANTYISHAEGCQTITVYRVQDGRGAHAEGYITASFGSGAHAEGSSRGYFAGVKVLLTGEQNVTSESHTLNYDFPDNTAADLNSSVVGMYLVYTGEDFACNCLKISAIDTSHQTFQVINPHPALTNAVFMLVDNIAIGGSAHTEGSGTQAIGTDSHTEGIGTIAKGVAQHAQGKFNIEDTSNTYAHIVGNGVAGERSNAHTLDWNGNAWYAGTVSAGTVANPAPVTNANDLATKAYVDANAGGDSPVESGSGVGSVQTKSWTVGTGDSAITNTQTASGTGSFAEGCNTQATDSFAHAEGYSTKANGMSAHAEGEETHAQKTGGHAEGYGTIAGKYAHSEGETRTYSLTLTSSIQSTSNTVYNCASIPQALRRGMYVVNPSTNDLVAITNIDTTNSKITLLNNTLGIVSGLTVTVYGSSAYGDNSHSEGYSSVAFGTSAHSEGANTSAYGDNSHAEGSITQADGINSHAEGSNTYTHPTASNAHVEGLGTIARGQNQHVEGKYNIEDTQNQYAHITGIGYRDSARRNGFTVDWNGAGVFAQGVKAPMITGESISVGNNNHTFDPQNIGLGGMAFGRNLTSTGNYSVAEGTGELSGSSYYLYITGTYDTHFTYDASDTNTTNTLNNINEFFIAWSPDFNDAGVVDTINRSENSIDINGLAGYVFNHTPIYFYPPNTGSNNSHSEGYDTHALGISSHAEGSGSTAGGYFLSSEAYDSGDYSGYFSGADSHAEGSSTLAIGEGSHSEGYATKAIGNYSHASGFDSLAYGLGSNASTFNGYPGYEYGESSCTITGYISDTTYRCNLSGTPLPGMVVYVKIGTQGFFVARKIVSVTHTGSVYDITFDGKFPYNDPAFGSQTTLNGWLVESCASGIASHIEGNLTLAGADYAHSEGELTVANGQSQHVSGRANIIDTNDTYAVIVGNGTVEREDGIDPQYPAAPESVTRSNGYTLDWSGNGWFAGNITANGGSLTLHDSTGDVTITAAQLRQLLAMLS